MKTYKTKALMVWFIILSVLLVFLITATLVMTQNSFLYNTVNSVFGGERRYLKSGDPSEYQYYTSDYANKAETLTAAKALNERICEEGIILMKNEDNALPLESEKRVTVFGKNSVNLVLGGSGSSAGGKSNADTDLYKGLEKAGFTFNPVLKSYYESVSSGAGRAAPPGMGSLLTGFPIAEASSYPTNVQDSYKDYNDAALVVISRVGGEGYDLPRTMFYDGRSYTNWAGKEKIPGARSKDDHYLQLDENETAMLREAGNNFGKVIVVINSSSPIELGFLDDPGHYAYHPNIKAALWIGHPGGNGIDALGKVLNGTVNPSGRTVDTYARDFTQDPTWNNFGNNRSENGSRYSCEGQERNAWFVEYEEGIYVGYRYYETRGFTEGEDAYIGDVKGTDTTNWTDWYQANVVYPFGYGLSYTPFQWDVTWDTASGNIGADGQIEVTVNVTNKGKLPGKDVVQLYYSAPYTPGGIEKAHNVLGAFGKTKELAPGESQPIKLTIRARDMASYDFDNANDNEFKGYELDAGNYDIKIMRNAHDVVDTATYYVSASQYEYDDVNTTSKIRNLFDEESSYIEKRDGYLSRNNWTATWPTAPTTERRDVSKEFIGKLTWTVTDTESDPWYTSEEPVQSDRELSYNQTEVKLYDMIGKDYGDELWDKLLDQLTVSQMALLISVGNYRTLQIESIDKPITIDADGPAGFAIFTGDSSVYDTCYYASQCLIGATWNEKLAEEMGVMIGNESIIGNEKGDGQTYSGWYAPAVNIHRSQFGGRNFEYYSEDGLLSGKMAQAVVKGAMSKGVYTFVKHFALNEQESDRDTTGLITWANEQAMRELYFKPFEFAVKEGGTTAVMSSFNRIGTTWAGGDHRLLTELLRREWGFEGMVITDFNLKNYMNVDQMVRAGGDLNLSPSKPLSQTESATAVSAIRAATKNILYTIANSNAMNGLGKNVRWGYALPWWLIWVIVGDCAIFAVTAGTGALFFIRRSKNNKKSEL